MHHVIATEPDDLLRFPIGKFSYTADARPETLGISIGEIEALPAQLRQTVSGLSGAQLDTPYRPGGWTVRQVVHHLADSHMNAFIRVKLALTEDNPTIKPYEEHLWAELPDSKSEPVESSLKLLEGLHRRWGVLLRALTPADFQKSFQHPQSGTNTLARATCLYAWHGRHHLAHITSLAEGQKW